MSILKRKNLTRKRDLLILLIFLVGLIVILAYIFKEKIFAKGIGNIAVEKLEKFTNEAKDLF